MPFPGIYQLIEWTVVSMKPGYLLSDDSLQALRTLLPDSLIVAALDLIDRGKVTRYTTDWGRQFYEVSGSKEKYSVEVDLPGPIPVCCNCPAFLYAVLISDNQPMCKHVLAVQAGRRLNKCTERPVTQDELFTLLCPELKRALECRPLNES